MRDKVKTIGNLIDKQSVSFISSVDEKGFPNTKAMLPPRKREGIKVFYFTTNTSSMRVEQYRKNDKACIYFCDKRFFSRCHADRKNGSVGRCRFERNDLARKRYDVLSARCK